MTYWLTILLVYDDVNGREKCLSAKDINFKTAGTIACTHMGQVFDTKPVYLVRISHILLKWIRLFYRNIEADNINIMIIKVK